MTSTTFSDLHLDERILNALEDAGYSTPTEIQAAAIPLALEGKDLMASAQTGTGKTAAFVLPMLQLLYQESEKDSGKGNGSSEKDEDSKKKKKTRRARKVRGLVLSPTRELAQQIEENVEQYAKYLPQNVVSLVGGLSLQRQIKQLQKGVDIVIATPGRLLDLLQRKEISLRDVDFFVLDEADRMLDMGFVDDVRDIARRVKKERQTFLFSATTSDAVESLSRSLLTEPERVAVHPPDTVGENIDSRILFVERKDKRDLVADLLSDESATRVLIFTATKSDANVLAAILSRKEIDALAIHSDKSQKDRQRALQDFDEGKVRVLVATDVMARGIDVGGITHVINYDLPNDPENFVHRIGRTARAGTKGIALSLCDLDEIKMLRSIERFTKKTLAVDSDHPYHSPLIETMKNQRQSPFARRGRRGGRATPRGGRGGRR
ncbi:DEAD/DEAH box helicase [bacterium]|nr:DEAD/DEAH box helicase [bacterium]